LETLTQYNALNASPSIMTTPKTTSNATPLGGLVAVVTGASSGIGRATAISLARHGAAVCAVGRNAATLGETISEAQLHSRALPFQADLAVDANISDLEQLLAREFGRLDILVHCAGVIRNNPMHRTRIEDLDDQYAVDVRAPYLLTKSLLPMLKISRGQIVFINSTLGVSARRPEVGQFAATQHAMKAIADSLREEVNPEGIRILTVYPGRTATPRQKRLYQQEGKVYRPELLMQPEDVAAMVISALSLPRTAEVTDISMRPMRKSY
jgi:NADP-dependent 3-hydroxy acid dehydrogenase YdfG